MVQSVEMLLDAAAERVVLEQWAQLADAGLPSQARHTGATNRPHLTLAVAGALDPGQEAAVRAAVTGTLPVAVRLGGLLVFGPGPFILCRLVVPSTELLDLQRRVVTGIGPVTGTFPHQEPGCWTAHITLARRLTAAQLAGAATILSPVGDLQGQARAVRRWDGERRIAWTIATDREQVAGADAGGRPTPDGSGRRGTDQQTDAVGDHHRDGPQE